MCVCVGGGVLTNEPFCGEVFSDLFPGRGAARGVGGRMGVPS